MTVLLGLVRAQLDAGDAVGAIETRSDAVQAASQVGDAALVVAALTSLDGPLVWLPRPMGQVNTAMIQLLERALTSTPAPSPAERCMLLATLAVEIYAPATEARCDDLTAEALHIAEGLEEARTLAFALNARVMRFSSSRRGIDGTRFSISLTSSLVPARVIRSTRGRAGCPNRLLMNMPPDRCSSRWRCILHLPAESPPCP